jgi:thymidylate synthase (FAD)
MNQPKQNVELVSYTPEGDLLVVNAARCSFDKEHRVFDEEKDARLINYLAKHKHVLPFRHPSVTLRLDMPIFVARQLGKHQVGFSWSEVSRRYVKSEPEFYYFDALRPAADNVKQGSQDVEHPENFTLNSAIKSIEATALETYNLLLERGVCAEQARAVLPQSMFTTTVTTGTLLGWYHLYQQRTDPHTQIETREYAEDIGAILEELYPYSWRALCEHRL